MFKQNQIVDVHWDGKAKAQVVAVEGDQVTIQRTVGIKPGHALPYGDTITMHKKELAQLAITQ